MSTVIHFEHFPNFRRQQAVEKESGTSISGRRKISKSGNGTVRKILYFPTLAAISYNKRIKAVYERLILHFDSKTSILAISEKQNAVKMGINEKRDIRFVKNVVSRVI